MFGIELEFFLLDSDGNIKNQADKVLSEAKGILQNTSLKQECGHSMIELTSYPSLSSRHAFSEFFHDYESLLYYLEKDNMRLFSYGTYPGENQTNMRQDPRYLAKENILGKDNWQTAAKCVGFHYHFSLPRNTFNPKIKFFYPDINPRNKAKVLNMYNLFSALDPAICTFMQSSPYIDGRYLGKDSRMIMYRSMFDHPDALYSKHPEFGQLEGYFSDFGELTKSIRGRMEKWTSLLKASGYSFSDFVKEDYSVLDSTWQPVKVSPHGTIESRGSDMNFPSAIVAGSVLLRRLTKYVRDNDIHIVPSEIGDNEPWKLEDKDLYVPRHEMLTSSLQEKSAIKGLESREIRRYCSNLLRTVEEITGRKSMLDPFYKMLDEEKTASDRIVSWVEKWQGRDDSKVLREETAKEIALDLSDRVYKDLLLAKKMTEHE